MITTLKQFWINSPLLFDPVQKVFNGSFWLIFKKEFSIYLTHNILDLACGTGQLSRHISSSHYLGLDINQRYINYARKKHKLPPKYKFQTKNIITTPLPPGYQTAFLISAAHHLSDDQLTKLARQVKNNQTIENFIIVDGYPVGPFASILKYLDATLGGGKYFRTENQLKTLLRSHLKIKKSSTLSAKRSLYKYPYLITSKN